ncbi:MAG: GNAT family N-acetyltransferase [Steroidobacteraceae bacterium]
MTSDVVRRAQPGDARSLAELAERVFREAFAAVNTPENMARHCRDSYGESIQAREISDPRRATFVCERHGRLVGYAQLRWGPPPRGVVGSAPGEIQRLYVAGECHGRGVAQRLMQACLDELAARGSDVAWLGVWEHNPRAIAFYGKYGFVAVGEQVFPVGDDPQRDFVMARPVAGRPADARSPDAQPPGT